MALKHSCELVRNHWGVGAQRWKEGNSNSGRLGDMEPARLITRKRAWWSMERKRRRKKGYHSAIRMPPNDQEVKGTLGPSTGLRDGEQREVGCAERTGYSQCPPVRNGVAANYGQGLRDGVAGEYCSVRWRRREIWVCAMVSRTNTGLRDGVTGGHLLEGLPEDALGRAWSRGDREGDVDGSRAWSRADAMVACARGSVEEVITGRRFRGSSACFIPPRHADGFDQ
ncbi:hypothetical protein DFH09DRAFT_1092913 [Mycena vulgaris]|nr:hypothetical protein DFH09DRAFT_1092913 [Mycena vulgaris]